MDTSEQDRVRRIIEDTARGNEASDILEFDSKTKRIKAVNKNDPDRKNLSYNADDLGFSGRETA